MEKIVTSNESTAPQKHIIPTLGRDFLFFFLIFGISLIVANGIYAGGFALGFSAGTLLILIIAFCYLYKKFSANLLSVTCLCTSLILILSFALHESTSFAFFKLLFLILSISVFFVAGYQIKAPSLDDFRVLFAPFYLLFGAALPSVSVTARSLTCKNISAGKKIGKILLGLVISVPLLLILTFLLIYADTAFELFFDSIDLNLGELFYTTTLAAVMSVCIFPLIFTVAKDSVLLKSSERRPFLSLFDATFINTVLVSVSLLYLLFLASQSAYLGGGFAGLLPDDYTYSAYARRGFFEMCIICVINLGIIFLSEVFVKRKDNRLPRFTRTLNTFISAFSIFLIASAIAKMFMYIRIYGLTFLRLGTSIFMFILFFVFTSLILKNFINGFKATLTILICTCTIMSLFAIYEPYKIIAEYNTYAYKSGMMNEYELDTNYLAYHCGAYGVNALISLSEDENAFVSGRANEQLKNLHSSYYYRISNRDLREISLATVLTDGALKEYYMHHNRK